MIETVETDVVVIGGGAAGANAALKAAAQGARVALVVKGLVGKSGCSIFGSHLPYHDMSSAQRAVDRLTYSVRYYNHYLTDQDYCLRMGAYMREEFFDDLERIGVYWRRDEAGKLLAIASRTPALVAHKQGASGMILMDKRRRQILASDIALYEECAATSLVQDDGRIVGVTVLDYRRGRLFAISAKAVVLATGHSDYLATRSTGTREQSADGIAMASDVAWTFTTVPSLTEPVAANNKIVPGGAQKVTIFIPQPPAGSGALAAQLLEALGDRVQRYSIVDLSGTLRQRQAERLAAFGERVRWLDTWPEALHGVVVGNEVLDAMPVQLLHWDGEQWFERGVTARGATFAWSDRATVLRPPTAGPFVPGTVTEIHPQAEAFIRTLAGRLRRGAAFFIDYGFPEAEYYHPQRSGGTLMCHRAHRADTDPLADVGAKDITAHVDFSAIALAAQDAGLDVVGYTSQARFLLNCGLLELLADADLRSKAAAHKLLAEHEMGELFKVIGLARGVDFDPIGFRAGDRCHML